MAKPTAPSSPVAVAGAGFRANSPALQLAAWANQPGMPPAHSNEAQHKSDALAAKEGTAHTGSAQ